MSTMEQNGQRYGETLASLAVRQTEGGALHRTSGSMKCCGHPNAFCTTVVQAKQRKERGSGKLSVSVDLQVDLRAEQSNARDGCSPVAAGDEGNRVNSIVGIALRGAVWTRR